MIVYEIIPEDERSGVVIRSLEEEAGNVLADYVLSDAGTVTNFQVKTVEISSEEYEKLPESTGP